MAVAELRSTMKYPKRSQYKHAKQKKSHRLSFASCVGSAPGRMYRSRAAEAPRRKSSRSAAKRVRVRSNSSLGSFAWRRRALIDAARSGLKWTSRRGRR